MKHCSGKLLGKNDNVQTPLELARGIVVYHILPHLDAKILEPCSGTGNFVHALKERGLNNVLFGDIKSGYDYLKTQYAPGDIDIQITNPPWSLWREFLVKAMQEQTQQIIYLLPVNKVIGLKSTLNLLCKYEYAVKAIKQWRDPTKKECEDWPRSGFALASIEFVPHKMYPNFHIFSTTIDLDNEWVVV